MSAPWRPEPGSDDEEEYLAEKFRVTRAEMIDRGARAVFLAMFVQAGRTALPADFDKLQPATRERCEIVALRVLQATGFLPP